MRQIEKKKYDINQFKGGAILSYINMAAGMIVSFLYTPFMLRIVGQSEFGLISLSNSVVSYLGLLSFGFGSAIIRYTSKYRAINDKDSEYRLYGLFITLYLGVAILAGIIGTILVINADKLFKQTLTIEELQKVKILMGITIFSLAASFPLSIFSGIIQAYEKFVFPKIISLVSILLSPIIIIPLLLMGYKSLGICVASAALTIGSFLMNVIFSIKKLKIKVVFGKFDIAVLKEIATYSAFIFLAMIADQIMWSADQVILGAVSGTSAVAVYAISSTLNNYYMSFSTNISSLFFPKVSRMVTLNSSDEEISKLFIKVGRIQYIIVSFILSGFILFGRDFIILWAGEAYKDAYIIALLIMIPITIPRIQNVGIYIQQAKNIHWFRSCLYICIAIVNVVASIFLAKKYGGIGCAAATGASLIIGNGIIMNIYYVKKVHLNIVRFWKEIISLTVPGLITAIFGITINYMISTTNLWILTGKGLVFGLLYVTIMWLIGINKEEKELFGGKIIDLINKSSKRFHVIVKRYYFKNL